MRKIIIDVYQRFSGKMSGLAGPLHRAVTIGGAVVFCVVAFIVFAQISMYLFARSYVTEIEQIFDLNRNIASAIVWITFAAALAFSGNIFSFSRRRRRIGTAGILTLLVGHSLVLAYGTMNHNFRGSDGGSTKCYIVTRDSIQLREHSGVDPVSGRECRPITPEIAERVDAYRNGNRPTRIVSTGPIFFDPRTGQPIIWYSVAKSGEIQLFDLMGFQPETGDELLPVTREVAAQWKTQIARRVPKMIDDADAYGPFDPVTGNARLWYRKSDEGTFEFYDAPGYHPQTGEPLQIVNQEIIATWQKGQREKSRWYVITQDADHPVRYCEAAGIDQSTGRVCQAITPQILERLREYEKGKRPKKVADKEPIFFDLRSGGAIVWYSRDKNGAIELFDLMGYHPTTGDELLPITKDAASEWAEQQRKLATRAPNRVLLGKDTVVFDPLTGAPLLWFSRKAEADYEFFDGPGFNPRNGDTLQSFTKDAESGYSNEIESQRKKMEDERAQQERETKKRAEDDAKSRWYVITQDADHPVRYCEAAGIDQSTGRVCQEITSQVLERLREYEKGKRPKKVADKEPIFFDLRSGGAIVWYSRDKNGAIELFDLMGYHPTTGDELLPITKDVASEWAEQQRKLDTRAPNKVRFGKDTAQFDPKTGAPLLWFSRKADGEYEFFDGAGYNPSNGDSLKSFTKDAASDYFREIESKNKRLEDERAKSERDRQKRAEEDGKKKAEREAELRSAKDCDELAANPNDQHKVGPGVEFSLLKGHAQEAITACTKAVEQNPSELRFRYQLARALQQGDRSRDRSRALPLLENLVKRGYPAAYDNLGSMYYWDKRDFGQAAQLFRRGVQAGDPDAMVSLAEMIDHQDTEPLNPSETKLELYRRAAQLGSDAAKRGYADEQAQAPKPQQQRFNQLQQQQMILGVVNGFLQNIPRR